MIINVPYGKKFISLNLPDRNVLAVLKSAEYKGEVDQARIIREALNNPFGSKPLYQAIAEKKRICIVVSDYTRATPNRIILPPIIETIKKACRRIDDVKILVAYGLHKPAPRELEAEFLGENVVEEVEVVSHDAEDEDNLTYVGETSFGTRFSVNNLILESDLVILTGLIEPHFFAGYSGGRKSILPGVAGKEAIYSNHDFKMIMHPRSRYGVLDGNPIHEDMVEAAKMISTQMFLVNVTIDREHRVTGAFAGDIYRAHLEGVKFLDKYVRVKAPSRADIVITSNGGYPLDRDLYQAVKGMATGELIARRGGVIVLFAECIDGIGRGHENSIA